MITQDKLIGFFNAQITEDNSRLKVLAGEMLSTDLEAFKDACKGAAKVNENLTTRISEMRQIYGAVKFTGFTIGAGYHETVKAARDALKTANLKWDGSKPKTDEEKAADKASRVYQKAVKEVTDSFNWLQPDAAAKYQQAVLDKVAEINAAEFQKAQALLEEKLQSHVEAIINHGDDYAKKLIVELCAAVYGHVPQELS